MGYTRKDMQLNKMHNFNMPKPVINKKPIIRNQVAMQSVVIIPYTDRDRIPAKRNIRNVYNTYTNKVTDILKDDQWKDRRCFIIGGGSSLRDFDFSRLDNELTIGVNRIFEFYSPSIFYSMDTRFHAWVITGHLDKYDKSYVHEAWKSFKSTKVFLCPLSQYDFGNGVYVVNRVLDTMVSRDLNYGMFGGNNSGFGALMLAIMLGANPIYLMGFDMKAESKTHFHSGYPNQQIENLRIKLESYRKQMHDVSPTIHNMGFKVVNLNPSSGITCFEFDTINNVLNKNKEV